MLEYIKGKVDSKMQEYVVLDTGALGYRIHTSLHSMAQTPAKGESICFYTYLYVREDQINLYGFTTPEELAMFKLLITVNGVGPKAALAICTVMTPGSFGIAVMAEDVTSLSKAQGVGRKTAQRIVLDLKDKMKKMDAAQEWQESAVSTNDPAKGHAEEATKALMVLGYERKQAADAVQQVLLTCDTLEDVIRMSLKKISEN